MESVDTNTPNNVVASPSVVNSEAVAPLVTPVSAPLDFNAPQTQEQQPDVPFTLFEQDNQFPYTAKFFGFDRTNFEQLAGVDIQDLVPQMRMIENYVSDKITKHGFLDSTATFKNIVGDIKEMLGIRDYEPAHQQINKIARYLNDGEPIAREFVVPRSTKADELDHARNQTLAAKRQSFPNTRRIDNLFSKFFHR